MLERFQCTFIMAVMIILFLCPLSMAQNLMTFDYTAFSQSALAQGTGNSALDNLEIDISRLDISLKYSFQLYSSRTIITKGIDFSRLNFSFVNWDDPSRDFRPDKMYGLSYEFTIKQLVSTKWYLSLQALPGIYSEFDNLKDDDFRMQGAIILGNDSGVSLDYGLGIEYLDIWGESNIWPSFYLYWYMNPTNTLILQFPHKAEYNYKFLDGLEFGLNADLKGNRYHIDDKTVASYYENNSVQYSAGTAGLYAKIRVTGNLFGMFELGYTFRKFLEINVSESSPPGEFNSKNNFFIKLSLELRPSETSTNEKGG